MLFASRPRPGARQRRCGSGRTHIAWLVLLFAMVAVGGVVMDALADRSAAIARVSETNARLNQPVTLAPAERSAAQLQRAQATVRAGEENPLENIIYMDVPAGRVTIELRPDLAPNHVERIKTLARDGFYDGVVFHRVIDGFMAQTGDPTGTGMGGSDLPDLRAEFNEEPHTRGAVSMARTNNPHSANSQFFIVFDDATFLDRQYTVWGRVTDGMEHIDAIQRGEPPRNPDSIIRMRVAADVGDAP